MAGEPEKAMPGRANRPIELIAIVAVLVATVAMVVFILQSRGHDARQAGALAAAATVAASSSPSISETLPTTADPSATSVGSPAPELTLRTADQAVARATDIAHGLGAQHPHVAAVDERPLRDALTAVAQAPNSSGAQLSDDLSGWPADRLQAGVWVVQLDGDTFGSLTCTAGQTCGGAPTIVMFLDPVDGAAVNMTWGVTLPLPAPAPAPAPSS